MLALPSPQVAELVRQDPAGLSEIVLGASGPAGSGLSSNLARGYISADGTRQLLIARPTRPPYDTAFSRPCRSASAADCSVGHACGARGRSGRTAGLGAARRGVCRRAPHRARNGSGGAAGEHLEHSRIARPDPAVALPRLPQFLAGARRPGAVGAVAGLRRRRARSHGHDAVSRRCGSRRHDVRTRHRRRGPALCHASPGVLRGLDCRGPSAGGRWLILEHAARHVDHGGHVLRAGLRRRPEPAATRPAHRPQHGGLRPADPDSGARPAPEAATAQSSCAHAPPPRRLDRAAPRRRARDRGRADHRAGGRRHRASGQPDARSLCGR